MLPIWRNQMTQSLSACKAIRRKLIGKGLLKPVTVDSKSLGNVEAIRARQAEQQRQQTPIRAFVAA